MDESVKRIKVLCPWCNSEMVKSGFGVADWFCCVKCKATSPREIGIEDAYAAAIRRPLQKPLTLEEALEQKAVWLEFNIEEPYPIIIFEKDENHLRLVEDQACGVIANKRDYGFDWRCWATRPTEEERKAAVWK